jgi:hypothetical protein
MYTKMRRNKANGQKVYQMTIKDIEIFRSKGFPKCTKNLGVGLKTNHLAALCCR